MMGSSPFALGGWGFFFIAYAMAQLAVPFLVRGRTRKWSLLPVPVMLFVLVVTVRAYDMHSNLWPIWLILISPLALLYLVGLGVVAKLRKAPGSSANGDAP